MIDVTDPGLTFYVDKLRNREPFALVRYGDGEWSAIVQDRASCVGQRLNLPGMREAMMLSIRRAYNDPRYLMACHPNQARGDIEDWLREHQPPFLKWLDNRTLYQASRKGRLYPFVAALRELSASLVIIGPPHLRNLARVLPYAGFIEIPGVDAWPMLEHILAEAENYRGAVFSISAGPTSSPLVWRMFARGHCDRGVLLDVGSLWDVYCGKASRGYQYGMKAETIQRNLEGTEVLAC